MAEQTSYKVLARKYRPRDFSEMIGQEALVRTLTNAINSGRLAHAFMLTGVRGVGKTTTARIIARSLNCIGADGKGQATPDPCGQCEHCLAISEDRHVDVLEIDAASHTGVDHIRELTDSVRYAPASARYKIYIIDEVHMLSNQAFNALLKTLEEPPAHVKFIFATTEIRKVPVTVLSRCQRFDLRRVEALVLIDYFRMLLGREGVTAEDEALALIARAADGSVRDGLSLLDQAIALSGTEMTADHVRDMLGLADRIRIIDLFEALMRGQAAAVLDLAQDLARVGADPAVVLADLLDLTHLLSRMKMVPELLERPDIPEAERQRGGEMLDRLTLPLLNRAWQILLRGLSDVQTAPQAQQAAEMVLLRLCYAVDMPDPGALIRKLEREEAGAPAPAAAAQAAAPQSQPQAQQGGTQGHLRAVSSQQAAVAVQQPQSQWVAEAEPEAGQQFLPNPQSFEELVQLFATQKEMVLHGQLMSQTYPVQFAPGRLEIRIEDNLPANFTNRVGQLLRDWTGQRWMVSISHAQGESSLKQRAEARTQGEIDRVSAHPDVQAILTAFPGAKLRPPVPLLAENETESTTDPQRSKQDD